jgi:prevent-host-death family protein
MQTISATEAKNKLASVMEMAQKQPVMIERNGRPAVVMLSVEEYEKRASDTGREAFLALCERLAEASTRRGMTGEVLAALLSERDDT